MVATEAKAPALAVQACPDYYWQFRLDRLVSKKGGDLPFKVSNYPDVSGPEALYNAYYLDLTLAAKLKEFDWEAEKEINDDEWIQIYNKICEWTSNTYKEAKLIPNAFPENDFDLIKEFYPNLDYRELDTPFTVAEVGEKFPYKNLKQLYGAAIDGTLNVPGYSKDIVSLDSSEIRKELAALKERTLKKVDEVHAKVLAFAENPFPDEQSRKHYQELKKTLATFPQTPAAWKEYRANFDLEIEEMARMAAKTDDEHHHHEHDENYVSPAKAFELKYGRNIDEMQERMNKYKSNPEGFLEASILEQFGKSGLEIWKKSLELTSKVMSETDIANAEKEFASFLSKA